MLSRKCERCGSFYDYYEGITNNDEKANAILFIDRDLGNKYWSRKTYDLCPVCIDYIITVLLKEGK